LGPDLFADAPTKGLDSPKKSSEVDTVVHLETKGNRMNWDEIEGNWKQLTGQAKYEWGKLTGQDLQMVAGSRELLTGKIQERYGVAKDDAEKQIKAWQNRAHESWMK
jgi:uncharacterized protein YjbJ (UPF0337 family)